MNATPLVSTLPLPSDADRVYVVTDSNVNPLTGEILPDVPRIVVAAGEESKSLATVAHIWEELVKGGATRRSVIVNIGGGMVTDLGGFAAATFKRGIRYINIPTTILGAVDAAVGGKTGIDFMGLKNEIGAFALPLATCPAYGLMRYLPEQEWLSGYGEILKTALLDERLPWGDVLDAESLHSDESLLGEIIAGCVKFKEEVVAADPKEGGLRKILNLGHTAGHAFESLALKKGLPVPHGVAVAHGLLVTLIASRLAGILASAPAGGLLQQYAVALREYFPRLPIGCADRRELLALMRHDKKNEGDGKINFVLLAGRGKARYDCQLSEKEVDAALDIYCDMMG